MKSLAPLLVRTAYDIAVNASRELILENETN